MTLKQKIDDNFPKLLRSMDPSFDLLGRLRSVPFVKDHVSTVKQKATVDDKNDALLECLRATPEDIQKSVMNEFISALRSSGQRHVANIFSGENNEVPLSDEHCRTLTINTDHLCQFIDLDNGLLNKLVSTEVISLTDAHYVRAINGYNEKAGKVIDVLLRKSDDAFDGFINALNETGQSHVAYILTGRGNSRPLKEEHIKRLTTNDRSNLVQMIDSKSSGFLSALINKGVFSDYDKQRVTGVQPDTTHDRNEIILDLIARKSQSDFLNFISALKDTNQMHVAVSLIGADVVANIMTVYESGADAEQIFDVDAELSQYMLEMFQTNSDVVKKLKEHLSSKGVYVSDVRKGSVNIIFTCESDKSLEHLRELIDSGNLNQMLNEAFCSQFENRGLKSLKIVMSNEQFERCAKTFVRWVPVTSEHRQALFSSEEKLLSEITVSGELLDKLSLCRRRRQAVEQAATHEQRVKTLIDIVSRRPDSAFGLLVNALNDTDQYEAAEIISGDNRNASKTELNEPCTENVWTHIQKLLCFLRKAMGDALQSISYPIHVVVRGIKMSSGISLREQPSVSTLPPSVSEEQEQSSHMLEQSCGELDLTRQQYG